MRSERKWLPWVSVEILLVAVLVSCAKVVGSGNHAPASPGSVTKADPPNIVVVMTDDQRFDSLRVMPHVRLLMDDGVTFTRAFVTNSVCCASRATFLTGGFSHTTKVYTNVFSATSPYGGFEQFRRTGDERGTIALALHDAGYRTALFGKYLNGYMGPHVPPGWDDWAAFSGLNAGGAYYDYRLFVHDAAGNRFESHGSHPNDYSTSVILDKAMAFLRSTPTSTPFFLELTPYAPHGMIVPAPRDGGTFGARVTAPDLPPVFDEPDVSDKPSYIKKSPLLARSTIVERYDLTYEALQAVDRIVGSIIKELRASGRSRNTLVLYTSDNGVEYGEHRWDYKLVPYDESIRVPLVVRYPRITGARAGTISSALVSNVDIAPTFADVAGTSFDGVGTVDGVSIVPILDGLASSVRKSLLLEHIDYPTRYHVPSYCGVRTRGWMYTRYVSGFEELYRMRTDPFQAHNLASEGLPELAQLRRLTRSLCRPLPPGYTWS